MATQSKKIQSFLADEGSFLHLELGGESFLEIQHVDIIKFHDHFGVYNPQTGEMDYDFEKDPEDYVRLGHFVPWNWEYEYILKTEIENVMREYATSLRQWGIRDTYKDYS